MFMNVAELLLVGSKIQSKKESYLTNSSGVKGVCKDYFQIKSGDVTNRVYNEFGSLIEHADDSALLWSSQYYDTNTGICSNGLKSVNKGKECSSNNDCPSSQPGIYATCGCGWSKTGKKFWDLLAGDEEWENARIAFKNYFDATKDDCNVAARWEECGNPGLYMEWKCKELKAQHYLYLLYDTKELPCMETLKTSLPIFKDIEKYCNFGSLFGASYIQAILAVMILLYVGL